MTLLYVILLAGATVWTCILWRVHSWLAGATSLLPGGPHRMRCVAAEADTTHYEELALSTSRSLWIRGVRLPSSR